MVMRVVKQLIPNAWCEMFSTRKAQIGTSQVYRFKPNDIFDTAGHTI